MTAMTALGALARLALAWLRRGGLALVLLPMLVQAQTTSTTSLASSPNPSSYAQSVTLTASVTGDNPTGTVTFSNGAQPLGSASLSGTGSTATASLVVSTLPAGTHSLTAAYEGDANHTASTSAAVDHVVNKAATTSAVTSSPRPSTYLANVTFTATVTGKTPTGDVTFRDGATVLGTSTLSGGTGNSRTATLAVSNLSVATHSISVVYAGDANNNTSTSGNLSHAVNKAPTTTALASSGNPSTYNQAVTFTATVSGVASPEGTVTFKSGSTTLGTATLAGGVATYATSTLAVGTHSITAAYGGNTTNNTSTSAAVSQVVGKSSAGVTLASSSSTTTAGQAITLTASVSGVNPTGSVTFMNGSTPLATRAVSGGGAQLVLSTLAAGAHSLTAVYSGDGNNLSATSPAVAHTVGIAPTSMVLSGPQGNVTQGQNVTLMAKITGFVPSGTVTFTDGGSTIGTAPVNGGAATLSINSLALGSHTLAASYAGDANNAPAASGAVSLTVVPRSGMVWQYGYDAMGRPNTIVDPNGQATYFYYDSLGRRIQSQQPPNTGSSSPTVIDYGYDLADSLTSVTDPRSLTTTYTPNGLGNVTSQTSPDSGASQFTYDAKGNVLTSTDARGKTTTLTYDVLDRVTSISYPSGTPTTFEYDGGANPTPAVIGELTKMTDESGQTTYSYDSMGRMTGKTVVIAGKTFTVGYSWGDAGSALDKLTAITYPSGSRVNYSYDQYGFVSGISVNAVNPNGQGASGTAVTLLTDIGYNAENKVTGWLWSDGKPRTIGYDSNGLISGYTLGDPLGTGSAAGVLRTLQRDPAGRITGYTHTNNGAPQAGLDQSFAYDNLDRLTTVTQASTTTQYSYDETGNRTAKTIGGTSYANTVSPTSNRLTQVQDPTGTATINYDAAGNTVGDGSFTYAYSDRGRMANATTASGTVGYLYDGRGQRVKKTGPTALVATGASHFVYDEAGQLLGEYDANGNPLYETVYLASTPVGAMKQAGSAATSDIAVTLYNVHADHIDTPRVITKQDQVVVWRWDAAEAFGATAPDQNPSGLGAFAYNQRFPGQVFDAETGLFQNWNREYNARVGRYIQSDPIGLAGGINTYSYVQSVPTMYTDPTGEFAHVGIGIGIGIASGIIGAAQNPCATWEDLLYGAVAGGVTGGVTALLPGVGGVVGSLGASAVRNGLAGALGSAAGQTVSGGIGSVNLGTVAVQGGAGAIAGMSGNWAGLGASLGRVRQGASVVEATAAGAGVGSAYGTATSTAMNAVLPPEYGGFGRNKNVGGNCSCRR